MTRLDHKKFVLVPLLLVGAALLLLAGILLSAPTDVAAAQRTANPTGDAGQPTVVELFQSQGCSSCPPANANLNAIAGREDVLALSFAVTYWDRLGWEDTFGQTAFTERQWDYARAGGRGNVATPQMIINGRGVLVGNRRDQLNAYLDRYRRSTDGPRIEATDARVIVGAARTPRPAMVWLVRYDPRVRNVPIRAGENGGRTLPHKNIVRSLESLGEWTGRAASFDVPPSPNRAYRSAVLVQQGRGGAIIAARRI